MIRLCLLGIHRPIVRLTERSKLAPDWYGRFGCGQCSYEWEHDLPGYNPWYR